MATVSPSLMASTTPRPFEDTAPPPTTTWVNRSQTELVMMLSDAYSIIGEREKDLRLAAEIGKSLLDNNIALKSKYEEAIAQSQQQLETINEFNDCDKLHRSIIQELELELILATQKIEELEKEQEHLVHSIINPQEEFADKEKSSTLATEIGRSLLENNQDYKEIEFVKDLEKRNQELQQQLDEALKEYNEHENSNKSKICQLESDLQNSQDACASATLRIEELENENERLSHREIELIQDIENRSLELQQQFNETIKECNDCDDLNKSKICKLESDLQNSQDTCALATLRIEELEKENEHLTNKAIELQQRLDESIKERNDCDNSNKSQMNELESELQHFQDACALATLRIEELEKDNERLVQKQKIGLFNSKSKYNKKSSKSTSENFIVLKFSNPFVYGDPQKIFVV